MEKRFSVPEDKVLLGIVTKLHGIRGEVVVHCFSGQPENMKNYRELRLINPDGRISVPLEVRLCRTQGKNTVLGFTGINTRIAAQEIVEAGILVDKEDLPELEENEFYWHQYVGKNVENEDGTKIGRVKELFHNGAQDVMVVLGRNNCEYLIPVTKDIVIREETERIVVSPPPGLLDINRENDDL